MCREILKFCLLHRTEKLIGGKWFSVAGEIRVSHFALVEGLTLFFFWGGAELYVLSVDSCVLDFSSYVTVYQSVDEPVCRSPVLMSLSTCLLKACVSEPSSNFTLSTCLCWSPAQKHCLPVC
jgi:hypothetical protein